MNIAMKQIIATNLILDYRVSLRNIYSYSYFFLFVCGYTIDETTGHAILMKLFFYVYEQNKLAIHSWDCAPDVSVTTNKVDPA
jgi:hypothetical protein